MTIVISVENLSKSYRLGSINSSTLVDDLNRWWARIRRQPDPLRKIGEKDHGNRDGESLWALRDITFQVQQGEVLGIIGRNGAGKSTLLKILSRVTAPTYGRIRVKGRVASLLEVGTGFHPDLTGRENIYLNGAILGMSRKEIDHKFDEIVDFAEIAKFIDTPVKRYSSGMYIRLAFAVAAHLEPEILIVDEVLAVGDAAFQKKCLGKMGDVAHEGRTVLFVSHNMAAVSHLCKSGILLENGSVFLAGNIQEVTTCYDKKLFFANPRRGPALDDHVIYQKSVNAAESDFGIVRIEILDIDNNPKNLVHTWDTFKLRIYYSATSKVTNGSVVLCISTFLDIPILRLSTQPDSTFDLEILPGIHSIDCEFDQIPLSAGDYKLGVGLAIPKREWLCWQDDLALFTIHPRDVYKSGLTPTADSSLLAIPHIWKVDKEDNEEYQYK